MPCHVCANSCFPGSPQSSCNPRCSSSFHSFCFTFFRTLTHTVLQAVLEISSIACVPLSSSRARNNDQQLMGNTVLLILDFSCGSPQHLAPTTVTSLQASAQSRRGVPRPVARLFSCVPCNTGWVLRVRLSAVRASGIGGSPPQ